MCACTGRPVTSPVPEHGEKYIAITAVTTVTRMITAPSSCPSRSPPGQQASRTGAAFRLRGGAGPRRGSPDRLRRAATRAVIVNRGRCRDRNSLRFRADGPRRWRTRTWTAVSHDNGSRRPAFCVRIRGRSGRHRARIAPGRSVATTPHRIPRASHAFPAPHAEPMETVEQAPHRARRAPDPARGRPLLPGPDHWPNSAQKHQEKAGRKSSIRAGQTD